jgi:hypothetical protein
VKQMGSAGSRVLLSVVLHGWLVVLSFFLSFFFCC